MSTSQPCSRDSYRQRRPICLGPAEKSAVHAHFGPLARIAGSRGDGWADRIAQALCFVASESRIKTIVQDLMLPTGRRILCHSIYQTLNGGG
jgi:hypothetical protein